MESNNQLPYIETAEEIEAKRPDFLPEDEWLDEEIADEVLDVTKEYPIRYSLTINGTPFAPIGGLQCQTGQPGHGKTMTLAMVAAAVLGDKSHGMEWNLSDEIPRPTVLYIDTEMERGNTMLVNKRICSMLGWTWDQPNDRLTILCLREVTNAKDRWKKVLKAIHTYRPTVTILDGLIDVVADFNDNVNCQELIFKCMSASSHYGMSFWCLIHENPGSEKMVGHAGSFIERKASDVMVTKKVKNEDTGEVHFELKNKKVRGKDWEKFQFRINDDVYSFGVPELLDNISAEQEEEEKSFDPYSITDEQFAQMQSLITSKDGVSTRDMVRTIRQIFHTSTAKADTALSEAVRLGQLFRAKDKRYHLPSDIEDGEAPF